MDSHIDYKNNANHTILSKVFKGDVFTDDILASWEKVISDGMITKTHKGVISDLRGAKLHSNKEDIHKLSNFILDNKQFFNGIKLAIIMDSKEIVYPMIFKMEHNLVDLECFNTKEAAEKWLLKTSAI